MYSGKASKILGNIYSFALLDFEIRIKILTQSIKATVFIEWYEQGNLSFCFKFLVQENLQLMAFYKSKDISFFMAQLGTWQTNLFPVGWPWSFTLSVLAY